MKIAFLIPYGSAQKESAVTYLLANYLSAQGHEVVQIRCNGIFTLCGRDAEELWNRNFSHCFSCIQESKDVARWGNFSARELSPYILAPQIEETKRWVLSLSAGQLMSSQYADVDIFELCRPAFEARLGVIRPDMKQKRHEELLRRYLLSSVRMLLAAKGFFDLESPDLSVVAGENDFISKAYQVASHRASLPVARFGWIESEKAVSIQHPVSEKRMKSELYLEDVVSRRADHATWPTELVQSLKEIIEFLDIGAEQMQLKLVQTSS